MDRFSSSVLANLCLLFVSVCSYSQTPFQPVRCGHQSSDVTLIKYYSVIMLQLSPGAEGEAHFPSCQSSYCLSVGLQLEMTLRFTLSTDTPREL